MPTSQDDFKSSAILMVAAEASSCMYAKTFMEQWLKEDPNCKFFGIGDREMQARGMDCQGLAEDLAVVGIQEVLSHWPEIKKTFHDIEEAAAQRKPQFALLFDYPGFNLRLAKKLKALGISVVYYISPQLWAWKKGRVKQVEAYVDDMLVVFPFEVDFYKQHGVDAHFVGHPLTEVIASEKASMKSKPKGAPGPGILGLMPGSRKSEIKFNLATQLETARLLKEANPDLRIKLLLAPTLDRKTMEILIPEAYRSWLEIEQEAPTQMILGCDLLLSASGTATLQIALCEKPMVVMYRMNSLTAVLAKMLVRDVKFFCIVNLIAQKELVPEFFQEKANPKTLATALVRFLEDTSYRNKVTEGLQDMGNLLGDGGATGNVVQYLKSKYLEER